MDGGSKGLPLTVLETLIEMQEKQKYAEIGRK